MLQQVRDRAVLHLTQLQGLAGGPEAVTITLDANLVAMEGQLREYVSSSETAEPFDLVSATQLPADGMW